MALLMTFNVKSKQRELFESSVKSVSLITVRSLLYVCVLKEHALNIQQLIY